MAITVPNTFADKSGSVQLADLDENFQTIATSVDAFQADLTATVDSSITNIENTVNGIEDPVAMSIVFGGDPQSDLEQYMTPVLGGISLNGTLAVSGTLANKQTAKAWAYVVSGTIVASYNMTGVSKPGTGRYLFTMTNALSDTNYTVHITGSAQVSVQHTNGYIDNNVMSGGSYVHSTTQFQIAFINSANSGNFADQTYLSVVVYGN